MLGLEYLFNSLVDSAHSITLANMSFEVVSVYVRQNESRVVLQSKPVILAPGFSNLLAILTDFISLICKIITFCVSFHWGILAIDILKPFLLQRNG